MPTPVPVRPRRVLLVPSLAVLSVLSWSAAATAVAADGGVTPATTPPPADTPPAPVSTAPELTPEARARAEAAADAYLKEHPPTPIDPEVAKVYASIEADLTAAEALMRRADAEPIESALARQSITEAGKLYLGALKALGGLPIDVRVAHRGRTRAAREHCLAVAQLLLQHSLSIPDAPPPIDETAPAPTPPAAPAPAPAPAGAAPAKPPGSF